MPALGAPREGAYTSMLLELQSWASKLGVGNYINYSVVPHHFPATNTMYILMLYCDNLRMYQ